MHSYFQEWHTNNRCLPVAFDNTDGSITVSNNRVGTVLFVTGSNDKSHADVPHTSTTCICLGIKPAPPKSQYSCICVSRYDGKDVWNNYHNCWLQQNFSKTLRAHLQITVTCGEEPIISSRSTVHKRKMRQQNQMRGVGTEKKACGQTIRSGEIVPTDWVPTWAIGTKMTRRQSVQTDWRKRWFSKDLPHLELIIAVQRQKGASTHRPVHHTTEKNEVKKLNLAMLIQFKIGGRSKFYITIWPINWHIIHKSTIMPSYVTRSKPGQ